MIHADAASCWLMLQHYCLLHRIRHGIINSKTSIIEVGRNHLVSSASMIEATHLLFLDSDIMCPPDTLERLLGHGKDMVGATYVMRRAPYRLTHTNLDGTHTLSSDSLHEVKRLPTGCLLIDMKVFSTLGQPVFRVPWDEKGNYTSEDNDFCDRARLAGYSCWLDPKLSGELKHLGQYGYSVTDAV